MDVSNAFLNAELDKDVYMTIPEGYDIAKELGKLPASDPARRVDPSQLVLKLNKTLYDLKQAPRAWYKVVSAFITSIGYTALKSEPCLFVKFDEQDQIQSVLALYVDDIVIGSVSTEQLKDTVAKLNAQYSMKNIGNPDLMLGINIDRAEDGSILLCQRKYIGELVTKFRLQDAKPRYHPNTRGENNNLHSLCPTSVAGRNKVKHLPYRELIGSLLYLAVATRPDIAYIVSELSRYVSNPGIGHWTAALNVLKYPRETPNLGVTFRRVDK